MNSLFHRDLWVEILSSLKSNGARTFVTAFGVFWGIFIMVLLLSAASGFETGIKSKFKGIATNSIFIWTQKTSLEYKGMPRNRWYHFDIQDAQAIKDNIKGLRIVSPQNNFTTEIKHITKEGSFKVEGNAPEFLGQKALKLTQGRFINQKDIDQKRKIAIIGWGLIDELYEKGEDVIGSFIKIKGVNFKVVGVFKDTSINGQKNIRAQQNVHIPFNTFSQVFNFGDRVNYFFITADDDQSATELKNKIITLLQTRHKINPKDKRAIGNFDLNEQFEKFNMLFATLKIVSFFVGIMILISGVIGISNIMLIVIKERTKEIGIRRALGATPMVIKKQIILESVFLTILSGMAGVSFASLILFFVNLKIDSMDPVDLMILNPIINLPTLFTIFIILVFFGLLAGLIPANKAVKMKPINAIRTE
ncbi:putative ABC transport system permease protein [Wenyingzhuangia heitensis]|uniref:ABC transport system permease protein n=1 Tax=Wenyingzhuangia heitensis TaxID=1487859 RepID=A0ABX0UEG0_9FLAO|nr:ABC transporter permease [Wenyingzhuangia heitensis]NIJ45586.1 putative ABC transport system permease protein [Wenyingzhuangia heitensis]